MPTYQVYITYSVDDSVTVDAESPEKAIEMVQEGSDYFDLYAMSEDGGYSIPWDNINVYDAQEM